MKNGIFVILFCLLLMTQTNVSSQQLTAPPVTTNQVQSPAAPRELTTVKTELAASQIQTAPPIEKVSFFKKLIDGIKSNGLTVLISLVCGILSKDGITKMIKAAAGKTTIIARGLGNVSLAVANASDLIDKSIADDGAVNENSLKDAAVAGKTVVADFKDFLVTIKPKPVTPVV